MFVRRMDRFRPKRWKRDREHVAITSRTLCHAPRMHVERLSRYSHQTLRIAQDLFSHRRFLKILLLLLSFLFSTTTAAMALRSNHHGTVEKESVLPECDQSSELTCRNGACVPLDSRCDGTEQCEDGSDELDCHSTLRPTTTRKYHAYVRPSHASNETQPLYPLLSLLVQLLANILSSRRFVFLLRGYSSGG